MASPYQPHHPAFGYYRQPPMPVMPPAQQPPFPGPFQQAQTPMTAPAKGVVNAPGKLPIEESYIENILRLNKGKLVQVYTTFEHNTEWNARIFTGIIEAAGRDYVILSNPETGQRYLIPMAYVDYVIFEEPIEYDYPFGTGPLASSPPK